MVIEKQFNKECNLSHPVGAPLASLRQKEMNVNVVSIFPTRLSKTQNSDRWSGAFRFCILEEDSGKLLDSSRLPAGIVIREWFFKGQSTAPATRHPASSSQATSLISGAATALSVDQQPGQDRVTANASSDEENAMLIDNLSTGACNAKHAQSGVDSNVDAVGLLLTDSSDC